MDKEQARYTLAQRELARRNLKDFVLLKWKLYNKMPFNDSWHYNLICHELEQTLPTRKNPPNTRLMLNMPPSYGKTEIIARCFIAWALGRDPSRKFFYISYSDELCKKISNQVRDLIKSKFFSQLFGAQVFLQDNANEFVLRAGGGLFVTTLKSAITGFHAHQIIIDDPIKVSAMNSPAERKLVNQNFKESVLSRLQDNHSNITILMQRLGEQDLCGFLLDPREFDEESRAQWRTISLKALATKQEIYDLGGGRSYTRSEGEALFPARHSKEELEYLRLQMGNDEFSTQYQQEPIASEAGYFEPVYFKEVPSFELGAQNLYIFVDNAMSLNQAADNRACVLIGVENYREETRYVVRDCVYGIWSEEQTIAHLIELMIASPSASVFIESDGGGLTLERLLLREVARVNELHKHHDKPLITNSIKCYTTSRKTSKVEKIKALRPLYNTGALVFLHSARGLTQIQKELYSFNPEKPFRKDDCIDCIASALAHADVRAPAPTRPPLRTSTHRPRSYRQTAWRI